jgi:hypothetical protein
VAVLPSPAYCSDNAAMIAGRPRFELLRAAASPGSDPDAAPAESRAHRAILAPFSTLAPLDPAQLRTLLESPRPRVGVEDGLEQPSPPEPLRSRPRPQPRLDTQRELRCGFPEVVFGGGKAPRRAGRDRRGAGGPARAPARDARRGRGLAARLAALSRVPCARRARARSRWPAGRTGAHRRRPDRRRRDGRRRGGGGSAELTARMLGARAECSTDVASPGSPLLARLRAPAAARRASWS